MTQEPDHAPQVDVATVSTSTTMQTHLGDPGPSPSQHGATTAAFDDGDSEEDEPLGLADLLPVGLPSRYKGPTHLPSGTRISLAPSVLLLDLFPSSRPRLQTIFAR